MTNVVALRGSIGQSQRAAERAEDAAKLAAVLRRGFVQRTGDSITLHFKTREEADLYQQFLRNNARRRKRSG